MEKAYMRSTAQEIAGLTHQTTAEVRRDISTGRLNLYDIASVATYLLSPHPKPVRANRYLESAFYTVPMN